MVVVMPLTERASDLAEQEAVWGRPAELSCIAWMDYLGLGFFLLFSDIFRDIMFFEKE